MSAPKKKTAFVRGILLSVGSVWAGAWLIHVCPRWAAVPIAVTCGVICIGGVLLLIGSIVLVYENEK